MSIEKEGSIKENKIYRLDLDENQIDMVVAAISLYTCIYDRDNVGAIKIIMNMKVKTELYPLGYGIQYTAIINSILDKIRILYEVRWGQPFSTK